MITHKMNNNTSFTSYAFGWISMLFGSFTLNEWAVIIGMLATIFGFFVTWYYKHLDYKLKKQEIERHGNSKKGKK